MRTVIFRSPVNDLVRRAGPRHGLEARARRSSRRGLGTVYSSDHDFARFTEIRWVDR